MIDLKINLPDHYLEEEVRCGFTVTRERKEQWAVELDLLNEFIRVCDKHGLRYCMAAGSLLGAIRHKGFIPWDDDIDVYMLRDDYDRFVALSQEFSAPYFLQTSATDKHYTLAHAKLRNSNTTGCTKAEMNMRINRGIFIDIFPLDGVCDDLIKNENQRKKDARFRKQLRSFRRTHYYTNIGFSKKEKMKSTVKYLISQFVRDGYNGRFRQKSVISREFENNLKRYSDSSEASAWGNRTLKFGCPKSRRPLDDWNNLTLAVFEFLNVSIPVNFDEILRQQYGNYMCFPKKLNGNMHGDLIVSTDASYSEYFK